MNCRFAISDRLDQNGSDFSETDCSSAKAAEPIGNWQSKIGNVLTSYQTSGSAQRSAGEPRQAGNGATVAMRACVAGKSGVWPILQ